MQIRRVLVGVGEGGYADVASAGQPDPSVTHRGIGIDCALEVRPCGGALLVGGRDRQSGRVAGHG